MYDDLAGSGDLLRETAPPDDAGAIRFRRVRDPGDVVNVTFRFLRDNLRELGRGLLVIVGPLALLAAMLSAWAQRRMEEALTASPDLTDPLAAFDSPVYVQWLAATVLVVVLVQLLIQAAVLGYVERYRRGEAGTVTPDRLWEATKAALGPVTTTTLLLLGFVFLGGALLVVPFVGAVALLVGAVYLSPIVTLLYVERVAEGDGFWAGFERTRALVRGRWGQTFGLLVVVTVLLVVVAVVLAIPGALVEAAFGFNSLEGGGALRLVALAVTALFGVLAYAAYVIPTTAFAFQYFSLVERKEAAGLLAGLDALNTESNPAPTPSEGPPWRISPSERPSERPSEPAERGFRGGRFDGEGNERGPR